MTPYDRRGLVALALLAAALPVTTGWGAGPAAAAGAGVFRPWALQSENVGANRAAVTPAQALLDAASNDVIMAHPIAYRSELTAMRQQNPRLRVYAYMNALYAQAASPDQSPQRPAGSGEPDPRPSCLQVRHGLDCTWPDSWYLRDASGAHVRSRSIGNYLMDPLQPGWRDSRVRTCRDKLADSGYDGCYLDMLGPVSLSPSYVTAAPVDPRTGQAFTARSWIDSTAAVGVHVETQLQPVTVVGNGLSSGSAYFSTANPTSRILAGLDGGLAEAWLRGSSRPVGWHQPEANWKRDVDMIVDAERASSATGKVAKPVHVIYKLWTPATQAQRDAHRKYAMGTFLLGAGGLSQFFYTDDPRANRTATHPWYSFDIGTPTGAYAKVDGLYRRAFTRGLVLVNPTTATVTVPLGASYRSIEGVSRTQVTLAPNTAQILQK